MGQRKLTDKQTQILEYIRHESSCKGVSAINQRKFCQAVDLNVYFFCTCSVIIN